MNKKKIFEAREITGGCTEGDVLKSEEPFMFAHGVDPKTGAIIDRKSELYKKNMKDTIFIFPNSKGSTTGSMWFLETIRRGNAPKAIINIETEMIIATGAILGELIYGKKVLIIDRISKEFTRNIKTGEHIIIKTKKEEIQIEKINLKKHRTFVLAQ